MWLNMHSDTFFASWSLRLFQTGLDKDDEDQFHNLVLISQQFCVEWGCPKDKLFQASVSALLHFDIISKDMNTRADELTAALDFMQAYKKGLMFKGKTGKGEQTT